MFGHDEDTDNTTTTTDDAASNAGKVVQPMSTTPPDENVVGVTPTSAPATEDDDADIAKIVDDINAADDTEGAETVAAQADPAAAPTEPTLHETPAELAEIKKSALKELSPLLDELDQSADEKLDILMMTIQATDDQSLIPQAFETAKKIEDKKSRAEAMLDIIQEINYFTKKQ